jgi:hypothetical protein
MRAYFVVKINDAYITSPTYTKSPDQSNVDFKNFILGEVFKNYTASEFCSYININDKGYEPWLGSPVMFDEVYSLLFN